ncbi:transmembrane emp24 domain-containing protein 4 [Bos javanicus]|nr:transmembrane emp24 domain-containing protein 4 [Bos javanicus]
MASKASVSRYYRRHRMRLRLLHDFSHRYPPSRGLGNAEAACWQLTEPTAPPESGRDQPVSGRPACAHSPLGPVTWSKRRGRGGAGRSGRKAGVTAQARPAPGLSASSGSGAQVRACALGRGRALAGVWAGRRRAMGLPALLLLALCAASARGLYFHIGETEKRCFIEEIPDETMVIGNYRTQMWDKQKEVFLPSTPGLGMHVEVKDPEGKVVLSRQYGSEGRFTFTSHTPGDHQICLHSNSTRMALFAGGRLRVHLDIQVGEHTNNYPEIAAKDKLTELQLRARQLLDQVEQIQKEQDYQRYREERFRLISESTNQRVLWWSIAQTVILILTGIWQMRHLKSFFEAKKLV